MPSDDHTPIAYFPEVVPDDATLRLAAAVVWRGVATPAAARGGGGPLGWLRGVRHRLWQRLGPLGLDVEVGGRPLFGGASGVGFSVGSAGPSASGEPMAYYDSRARVLRVLGRVVPAPAGRTLVALVDATGRRSHAPRLMLRIVPTPAIPLPRFESMPPSDAATASYFVGGEQPVWDAALRSDAVVGAFLNGNRID